MIARALLFRTSSQGGSRSLRVFSSFRVLKTTVIVTRKVTIWVRVCQGGINRDGSGQRKIRKPPNTICLQRHTDVPSRLSSPTCPQTNLVEGSSAARLIVLQDSFRRAPFGTSNELLFSFLLSSLPDSVIRPDVTTNRSNCFPSALCICARALGFLVDPRYTTFWPRHEVVGEGVSSFLSASVPPFGFDGILREVCPFSLR